MNDESPIHPDLFKDCPAGAALYSGVQKVSAVFPKNSAVLVGLSQKRMPLTTNAKNCFRYVAKSFLFSETAVTIETYSLLHTAKSCIQIISLQTPTFKVVFFNFFQSAAINRLVSRAHLGCNIVIAFPM